MISFIYKIYHYLLFKLFGLLYLNTQRPISFLFAKDEGSNNGN